MNNTRKLHLRTTSLVLTFAMILGCVCSTASAETSSEYVEQQSGSAVNRVYDSGNVTLSNKVEADKTGKTFKISLGVKVIDSTKLTTQTDSTSSDTENSEIKDSGYLASQSNARTLLDVQSSLTELQKAEPLYEVRYYIQPGFKVVESSIPEKAVLEEDGQYVSWPNLTASAISTFSTNIKLQAVTAEGEEATSVDNSEDVNDQSGVYQDGEAIYLFAQSSVNLPPITAKTATLDDWNARTYDINLSVTAQSKIVTSTTPCDIILVLDRSGSMANNIDTATYAPKNNPTNGNSYYIILNGNYQQVVYKYNSLIFWHSSGWYYDDGDWQRVYPSVGGSGSDGNYQFYTQTISSQTKLKALKTAANNFVDNVKTNSSDSRIGVVSFSSSAAIITSLNGKQLLKVGNVASATNIHNAINGLTADGATGSDYALQMVKTLFDATSKYESVTTESPRNKVVIFFTDGEPNHSSGFSQTVATAAIRAAKTLKESPYSATVYSIGVFSGLSGDDLTQVENYMKDVASPKPSPSTEKQYYPASDAEALNVVFDSISTEVGSISGATVTDVIDPRFELTEVSKTALQSSGAVVTNNSNGSQTIAWSGQAINVKKDAAGNLIPDWKKSFTVQAKDQFIGGNNIPTNVLAGSGVTYGTNQSVPFPQPTVNVRPEFYLGNADNTVFYGENVPDTSISPFTVDSLDIFCGKSSTGAFSYQWAKADGALFPATTAPTFPTNQIPDGSTTYRLVATFKPSASSADSKANTKDDTHPDGRVASDTTNTTGTESAAPNGKYTVNVAKGSLKITKTIVDTKGATVTTADPNQFFTFKIERYAPTDTTLATVVSTSYEVIYTTKGTGSKTITNLPGGNYKVTEIANSAWRYKLDSSTLQTQTKFIGRNNPLTNPPFNDSVAVDYKNNLSNPYWISSKDSVTNVFTTN